MAPTIRSENSSDHAAIKSVTAEAFLHAPHTDHNEQFIVAALRDAGALTLSLVAEVNGAIVGHIAVSPVSVSNGVENWFGMGPVSVKPSLHGQGIGSQLICEALKQLSATGAAGCVVLGDPAYYQRFGFKHEASLTLPDLPPEYFMAISFGSPPPQGSVTYHPAFSAST